MFLKEQGDGLCWYIYHSEWLLFRAERQNGCKLERKQATEMCHSHTAPACYIDLTTQAVWAKSKEIILNRKARKMSSSICFTSSNCKRSLKKPHTPLCCCRWKYVYTRCVWMCATPLCVWSLLAWGAHALWRTGQTVIWLDNLWI